MPSRGFYGLIPKSQRASGNSKTGSANKAPAGILDFSKATFSSGEDNMKKIREKFFRRIIAAILVFLSPIFIKLILKLANSVWGWISPETCIR